MTENELKRCREAQELLNCPFCNSKVELNQTGKMQLTIRCMGCSVKRVQKVSKFTLDWLRDKMIESWNTRAIEAHQSALLAKAVEALEKIIRETTGIVDGGFIIDGVGNIAYETLAEITKGD